MLTGAESALQTNRVTKYLHTQEYADGFDYDYGDVPNQAAGIAYLERLWWQGSLNVRIVSLYMSLSILKGQSSHPFNYFKINIFRVAVKSPADKV